MFSSTSVIHLRLSLVIRPIIIQTFNFNGGSKKSSIVKYKSHNFVFISGTSVGNLKTSKTRKILNENDIS